VTLRPDSSSQTSREREGITPDRHLADRERRSPTELRRRRHPDPRSRGRSTPNSALPTPPNPGDIRATTKSGAVHGHRSNRACARSGDLGWQVDAALGHRGRNWLRCEDGTPHWYLVADGMQVRTQQVLADSRTRPPDVSSARRSELREPENPRTCDGLPTSETGAGRDEYGRSARTQGSRLSQVSHS